MASREEEKRLRREEREKAEAAAAASQSRGKRLQYLIGALLTIAVVVGVVLLVTGGDDKGGGGSTPTTAENGDTDDPRARERDLEKAATTAECKLTQPGDRGLAPTSRSRSTYKTNPPTSGNHSATPALDGVYAPGSEPAPENCVHSLEHGRIVFLYKPGTPAKVISQLETLANEPLNGKAAYKALLRPERRQHGPAPVAATAWGQAITCSTPSDAMFDALRNFRVQYVDKGPEPGIPPTN